MIDLPDTIRAHYESIGALDTIMHVNETTFKVIVSREIPSFGGPAAWTDVWTLTAESDATRWIQES